MHFWLRLKFMQIRYFFLVISYLKVWVDFQKINKDFIPQNVKLYKLITVVEYLFNKHCRSSNSFDLILDDLISCQTIFIFQCKEHANEAVEMLAYIIQLYLQIQMRQFVRQEMAELKKLAPWRKKQPSFATLN